MAVGKGCVKDSKSDFQERRNDDARVKAGLEKFREAMMIDAKAISSRGSGLPKDARQRLIK